MKAYCYRTGVIEFGRYVPKGTLEIASGRALLKNVRVRARHAKDGETLLVPGIPEASNDVEAYAALKRFKEFVRK